MTSAQFDRYIRSILALDAFTSLDKSLNGIQVDNSGREIKKIAFAVDACQESINMAREIGADLLFVHHGFFWGHPLAIAGAHRSRIKALLDADIALYAVHLPLDMHEDLGNNAELARLLKLEGREPFGLYNGIKIGYRGNFPQPVDIQEAFERIAFKNRPALALWPFGPEKSKNCAIISGGGGRELSQAIDAGVDLYITGEVNHEMYHSALEAKINVICAGHYASEVWGLRSLMARVAEHCNVATEFIDAPSSL